MNKEYIEKRMEEINDIIVNAINETDSLATVDDLKRDFRYKFLIKEYEELEDKLHESL